MGARDIVVTPQRLAYPNCDCFLPNVKMGQPGHECFGVEFIDFLFELADLDHLLVHMEPLFNIRGSRCIFAGGFYRACHWLTPAIRASTSKRIAKSSSRK